MGQAELGSFVVFYPGANRIMSNMFLGLFPELSAVGGIQQVSRHVGATLQELAEREGRRCLLTGLNDPAGEGVFEIGGREYRFRGFSRSKTGLLAHLARRALGTSLVFATHVNLGPAALSMRMLQPRLRSWVMAHGMEVWEPLPLARRIALRQASGIVAVSWHTAEAVAREQGVDRGKIAVLHPALDPGYLLPDATPMRLPAPPGSRLLLTVARLLASEPGKGVDTVIRAMPRLVKAFPNLYYAVVGDGDARPSLEKLAAACGVAERVIFTGVRAVGSLRACYEAAEVFVMPSRQEGFGIVFLEAMAAGKPVVAAACGGAPEVVSDGETGFLVNYGDVEALAERLQNLLADSGLRQRMGEAGRQKAETQGRFEYFRQRLTAILGTHGE
jgi:phosphatidylinositol alpha-1,6-mannosyltransferase